MKPNTTKEKLEAGDVVVGVVVHLPSPGMVEIVGHLGFDFAFIDAEHGPIGPRDAEDMVRAAEAVGITPITRVPECSAPTILRYLDVGSHGIQVPNVHTAEIARGVVRAAHYWPEGMRGMAMARGADFGLTATWADYLAAANERTLLATHIESREAVENLPELLAVEGIDVWFIGPADLSQSMGRPGDWECAEVAQVVDDTIARIVAAGKTAGFFCPTVESARTAVDRGVRYLLTTIERLIEPTARAYLQGIRGT